MNFYKALTYFTIVMIFLMFVTGCQSNDLDQKQVNWIVENL